MLDTIELIGILAFAISGALVGINKKMDLFGVLILSITTSTAGGLVRDLIIGHIPPSMFTDPRNVGISAGMALVVFIVVYFHRDLPHGISHIYEEILFLFDSLGLAAFTVDGVMIGVDAGFGDNIFLISFLGVITGVGGGILRDLFADQVPGIFQKHVYALACMAGSVLTAVLWNAWHVRVWSMLFGFGVVMMLRLLAAHYRWNLPRIE